MADQRTFGRRGPIPRQQHQPVYATQIAQPIEVTIRRRGWGWGKTILVVVGGFIGLGILGNILNPDATAVGKPGQTAGVVAAKSKAAAPCQASLAEYEALQTGSSLSQAIRTIGCRGTELSRIALAGQESVTVSWDGNAFISNMTATFSNDRLVAKSQLGLE